MPLAANQRTTTSSPWPTSNPITTMICTIPMISCVSMIGTEDHRPMVPLSHVPRQAQPICAHLTAIRSVTRPLSLRERPVMGVAYPGVYPTPPIQVSISFRRPPAILHMHSVCLSCIFKLHISSIDLCPVYLLPSKLTLIVRSFIHPSVCVSRHGR